MYNKTASVSNKILDELFETVEVIGIEQTIKTLQEAKMGSLLKQDVNIDFILNMVSELTAVPKQKILYGNDRSDDKKMAIAVSVFLIKNEFEYSFSELKKIFNKDQSALCRYYDIVQNMSKKPKTDFDKKLDSILKQMNLLLTEKKLNNGK
jgi:chromosomal replication initiation ATPase DnaA